MAASDANTPLSTQPYPLNRSEFDKLWQSALNAYKLETGRDPLSDPLRSKLESCTSVDDIVSALNARDKGFKKFRQSGRKFWAGMEIVCQILNFVAETSGNFASATSAPGSKVIVVAVGRLLQAAKGVSGAYDTIEVFFSKLDIFLKRLTLHLQSPATIALALRDIYEKMLIELLSFVGLLTRYINESTSDTPVGRIRKFASRSVRRTKDMGAMLIEKNDVKDILGRFEGLTNDEHMMTAAATLVILQGVTSSVETITYNQINQDIREWLAPPDPEPNYNRLLKKKQVETCEWIFDVDFDLWRHKPNGLYWIYGNPGTGKSVLSSAVIRKLISENALVLYFYFDFQEASKQTLGGLLSSLVFQLAARSAPCYDKLKDLRTKNQSALHPNEELLTSCLFEMLRSRSEVFIILDALDECPEAARSCDLLPFLANLVGENITSLRLLATSRAERDIKASFERYTITSLDICSGAGHASDIARHVAQGLAHPTCSKWPKDIRDLASEVLTSKANGMFLWVDLQLQSLRRHEPVDIKRALEHLPASLDETYKRVLRSLLSDPVRAERVRRVFECIAFGRDFLYADGVAQVLAIDFAAPNGATPKPELRPQSSISSLLDSCSGLLHVVKSDFAFGEGDSEPIFRQQVQFIHFTVQEYLLSNTLPEDLRSFALTAESGHATLAQVCFATLASSDPEPSLREYAADNLGVHAYHCPNNVDVERLLSQFLNPNNSYFPLSLRFQRVVSLPLYWTAEHGLVKQLESLLDLDDTDIDAIGGGNGTALCAAACNGHLKAVKLLVGRGAAIEASGNYGPPLCLAAMCGRTEVVTFLLGHGARIDARGPGPWGDTLGALHRAVIWDRPDSHSTIMVLLEHGSDINVTDIAGATPLHHASGRAYVSKARLLLERSAAANKAKAINSRDRHDQTSLHWACKHYGDKAQAADLVSLLLKHGASLDLYDNYGNTPLHLAALRDHYDAARILLKNGAKVDVANHHGESPFQLAVVHAHIRISRLLLEWGSSPRISFPAGWTVLHAIASDELTSSKYSDVSTLLDSPKLGLMLDLEARTECGQTALSVACTTRNLGVVCSLISYGANVNAADSNGFRPIDYAAAKGRADVVELLLWLGADGWTESGPCGTFLDIASRARTYHVSHHANEVGSAADRKKCCHCVLAKSHWQWDPENTATSSDSEDERRYRHARCHDQALKDLGDVVAERRPTVTQGDRMMRRVRRCRSMVCLPEGEVTGKEISTVAWFKGKLNSIDQQQGLESAMHRFHPLRQLYIHVWKESRVAVASADIL